MMMARSSSFQQARRGFTLVELVLVAVVVIVVIGGMVLALAQISRQVWVRTDTHLATVTAAQQALDRLSEDLRRAHQAGLTCGAGQVTFTPLAGGGAITYLLDASGNLVRTQGPVSQIMAAQLSSFAPSCAGELVRVQITSAVGMQGGVGIASQTLSSQIWVRNP